MLFTEDHSESKILEEKMEYEDENEPGIENVEKVGRKDNNLLV